MILDAAHAEKDRHGLGGAGWGGVLLLTRSDTKYLGRQSKSYVICHLKLIC